MVSSGGHMESGLKEAPMQNSNSILVKGLVEYFDNIMFKTKQKALKVIFREAITLSSEIELGKD
jgi:hypothetical protein